jgi:hypothetical protein
VLEVQLLPVPVMVRYRLLHVLQLAYTRFLVYLRLLTDDLDLLLLLVLDLCKLSGFLFEEFLGTLFKVFKLFGSALFALEVPIETIFFSLHLTKELV